MVKQLICRWPALGVHSQAQADQLFELIRIIGRDPFVYPSNNCLFQRAEVWADKGRFLCGHFVQDAAEGPNITLGIVWFVIPYFWTRIVGCTCLSASHAIGGSNGHIHVSQLCQMVITCEEDIRRLDVPVQHIQGVESGQPPKNLESYFPNCLFFNQLSRDFVLCDKIVEITALQELSDDAEGGGKLVVEGVSVGEDVGAIDAGQESHLIEAVGNLLLGQIGDAYLLHGIFLSVFFALDFVDYCEGSLTQFCLNGIFLHEQINDILYALPYESVLVPKGLHFLSVLPLHFHGFLLLETALLSCLAQFTQFLLLQLLTDLPFFWVVPSFPLRYFPFCFFLQLEELHSFVIARQSVVATLQHLSLFCLQFLSLF